MNADLFTVMDSMNSLLINRLGGKKPEPEQQVDFKQKPVSTLAGLNL